MRRTNNEKDERHYFFGITPLGLSQSCGLLGAEEQTPLEPSRVRGWPGTCMFPCGRVLLVTTALGVAWRVGLGQRTQR